MVDFQKLFEPQNEAEQAIYTVEAIALSVQLALQKVMIANCVSQKELAERLGVSPARVSQLLSTHGANLTLKTIAKISRALGEDFEFIPASELKEIRKKTKQVQINDLQPILANRRPSRLDLSWKESSANMNKTPSLMVA